MTVALRSPCHGAAVVGALAAVIVAVSSCSAQSPPQGTVPDLTGSPQAEAIAALQQAGFEHIRTQHIPSSTVRPDAVASTDPPARSPALFSQTITIVVSTGPILVP